MLNVLMVSGHESSALPEQQHHSTGCIRPEAELCIHQSIHERMARLVKVYNLKGQATCTRNRLAWGMSCTALDRAQPHAVHLLIDNLMPTGDLQSGFGSSFSQAAANGGYYLRFTSSALLTLGSCRGDSQPLVCLKARLLSAAVRDELL